MKNKALVFIVFLLAFSYKSFAQQSDCDYGVEILLNGTEFEKDQFSWRMKATKIYGNSTNITGTAKIETSEGAIAKSYNPWASEAISKQKTSVRYSPNLKEGQEYKITAEISVGCNDSNQNNNMDTKIITIKNKYAGLNWGNSTNQLAGALKNTSNVNDAKSDNQTSLTKNKTMETTSDYKSQEAALPEQEEGLSTTNATTSGTKEEYDNVIQLTTKNKPQESDTTPSKTLYESTSEKSKNIILIALLILSILLNIILIWKR